MAGKKEYKTLDDIREMLKILVGFSENQLDLISDIAKKCYDLGYNAGEYDSRIRKELKLKEKEE